MALAEQFQGYFNSKDSGTWASAGDNPNPAVNYINAPFTGKEKNAYLAYAQKRLGARYQNQHNGGNLDEHQYAVAEARKFFKSLGW